MNAVSPGPIDTGMLERAKPSEIAAEPAEQYRTGDPTRRRGDPSEIAATAAFPAFEATYSTGAEFPVDGGASQL